jgi:hypothetical protein
LKSPRNAPPVSIQWRFGLIAAFFLLFVIDASLRLISYKRLCRWLIALSPHPDPARYDLERAYAYGRLVNQAASVIPWITCLRRSLATWWLMRWAHLPSDVCIGVKLVQDDNTSHSWVEHHGEVINDASNIAIFYPINFSDVLDPERIIQPS